MDLKTKYLGFSLPHPVMPGASPLSIDLDVVRELEDAGAAAITMPSLFEEQIERERLSTLEATAGQTDAEASRGYFPEAHEFRLGPEQYLERVRQVKEAVSVPVIASLNGVKNEAWLEYAKLIQQAGADALELNIYFLAGNPSVTGASVDQHTLEIVKTVKKDLSIPIAVKLSPFYSSIANIGYQLDKLGADGLVLFNRFYQPDIDIEKLEVIPTVNLSDSSELLLRLRWIAMLAGKTEGSICANGGVHTYVDVIKAIMAGANAVQMVSAILRNGPHYISTIVREMKMWMEEHEYESVAQMQGSMSYEKTPDPAALERANYARILQSWRPEQLAL